MPIPTDGAIYTPASGEIAKQWLDDYSLGMQEVGVANPAIQQGTEPYIRAVTLDNALQGVYFNLAQSIDATSELTATGEDLDRIRQAKGLAEVAASPSAGKLVVSIIGPGVSTFADGLQFQMPNGKLGQVFGTQLSIANGDTVNVIAIDTGRATNLAAGTKVKWLSPPPNVLTDAVVEAAGLTGATDAETDERKRARIINLNQNAPASGNWGYVVQLTEAASGSIAKAFVYPALGGPGSYKVVIVKDIDADSDDFSRELADAIVTLVENALVANMPAPFEGVIQSAVDEPVDVSLGIAFSDPAGTGAVEGWENLLPFPRLSTSSSRVPITTVNSTTSIVITKSFTDGSDPVAGNVIAWWSPAHQDFVRSTISSFVDGGTTWTLTLDAPLTLDGDDVVAGDYISPAAFNMSDYRLTWLAAFNKLGPGENSAGIDVLSQDRSRGWRRPYASQTYPYALSSLQLSELTEAHDEILSASYLYTSATTPTVPALLQTAPNVLTLNRFGIYPKNL